MISQPWMIRLLGGLRLTQQERTITRFRTQKTAALLAYLAYHRHRSHSREVLIELFWPEAGEESGRHSLSLALSSLRHQLEPPGVPAGSVIVADRRTVELNPDAFRTDVADFEKALRAAAQARADDDRIRHLRAALEVYGGQLLPGFYEEWILTEQEHLAERHQQAVSELVALLEKTGDYARAIEYARRRLSADPLREDAHRDLMRLLADSGQPAAALRQYRDLERLLNTELGDEPSRETRQLARQIQQRLEAQPPEQPPVSARAAAAAAAAATFGAAAPARQAAAPTPAPLPTGTVTFLLTDIEGSTALYERTGDAYRSAQSIHHGILRREFQRHGGREVHEAGDGFVAAFASAGDALACAVAAQRALLATQQWPAETGPLPVRMAIHSGDVDLLDGTEYQGIVLHRAARLRDAAHGGQVLCSEATCALLRRDLETEVRLRDLGLFRLRDVESPERIFQVEFSGAARSEFPPIRAERAHTGSLPLQFTRFFGREKEIERLCALIADPSARLVTLTGPGGAGKTRLSVETAGRMVEPLAGAVWFVPLADVSDPRLIPDALLDALQIARSPEKEPLEQAVEMLSRQPSLLVLDNMEQVAEEGALVVQRLLERAPTLTCLVTSRQILGLPMERDFPVPPLATPGGKEAAAPAGTTPERLGVYDSVRLFVDRAQAVKPDFQVTNANAPAVAELCDRLEGIPLAIELAAARAQVLTPQQMLQQLGNRFELLVSRRRGVVERQRTLRAAVDWSYRLLSPELQRFFTRLCVFRGGWSVEAAEAVCDEPLTLDLLAQLRECSLVITEEGAAGGGMRFRMLETLREYASDHLQGDGRAQVEERHASYCLALAETAEPELRGPEQAVWLARLAEEQENLRQAASWVRQNRREEEALRLVGALWYFWSIRSHLSEGRAMAEDILVLVPAAHPALGRSALRAKALLGAGALAHDQSRYEEAVSRLDESVGLFRETGEREGLAAVLNCRANVALDQGESARAMPLYQEALGLFREAGDTRGASIVLSNLGVLAFDEGDAERAAHLLSESVQLKRRLGNRYGLANSLEALGNVERGRDNHARAIELYKEVIALREEIGHRHGVAVARNNLAHSRLCEGDAAAEAKAHLSEAFAVFEELGEMRGLCECLALLSGVAAAQGRMAEAARCFGAAQALRAANGITLSEADGAAEARLLEPARAALGEKKFASETGRGKTLGAGDAAALALLGSE